MIVETVRSAFPASLPRLLGLAVCSVFALGTGNNVIVMFAIALASASLLTTVGMIVPMDPFAPVTGSALGTTGMSGHEEDGAAPTRPWILLVSPAIALGGEPLDPRGGLGADWRPSHPVQVGQLIMETGGASGFTDIRRYALDLGKCKCRAIFPAYYPRDAAVREPAWSGRQEACSPAIGRQQNLRRRLRAR